jgi:hypothetical protein
MDTKYASFLAGEGVQELAGGGVPQLHPPIQAAGGQPGPIRAEHYGRAIIVVPMKGQL